MPNWCENRVRLSDNGDNSEQFDRLCEIMNGPEPFNTIFPRPDFTKIPNPTFIFTGTEILKRIMTWAIILAYVKSVLISITQRVR